MIKFFTQFPEIKAVMSEREDGTMRLRDDNANMENRNRFFQKAGIDGGYVVGAKLENGTDVKIISDNKENIVSQADALVTKEKNVFLSISVADCIPVYFYESKNKIVAISHCGWRGIVGGIIKNTFAKISELGGEAENLKVALGPGINKCHFEIGEDTLDKFKDYPEFIIRENQKIFVDLKGIIMKQLNELGINPENIENNSECTFENKDKYFSFRRDKPEIVEAMVAVIGML